jgi:hypothetical protein
MIRIVVISVVLILAAVAGRAQEHTLLTNGPPLDANCINIGPDGYVHWGKCYVTCIDGYEPVMRSDMRAGCAKDIQDPK